MVDRHNINKNIFFMFSIDHIILHKSSKYCKNTAYSLQWHCITFAMTLQHLCSSAANVCSEMQTICSNNAISTQWLECCILPPWESVRVANAAFYVPATSANHHLKVTRLAYKIKIVVVELQQFGVILKILLDSPAFRKIFSKPFNSFTGRVTLPTRSRI